MTELELQQYLLREYPQENARCEWKEFKNLKNSFCGDEKRSIIDLVYHKLCNQPNSSYNQLWLQNMTYTQDKKQGTSPNTLRLCQLVAGKVVDSLWNNDWLKSELTTNIPYNSVVDGDTLKKVDPVITFRETRTYIESAINES